MITENVDNLMAALSAHGKENDAIIRQLNGIIGARQVLESQDVAFTSDQYSALVDSLSLDKYAATDAEALRIFSATEPEPDIPE